MDFIVLPPAPITRFSLAASVFIPPQFPKSVQLTSPISRTTNNPIINPIWEFSVTFSVHSSFVWKSKFSFLDFWILFCSYPMQLSQNMLGHFNLFLHKSVTENVQDFGAQHMVPCFSYHIIVKSSMCYEATEKWWLTFNNSISGACSDILPAGGGEHFSISAAIRSRWRRSKSQ